MPGIRNEGMGREKEDRKDYYYDGQLGPHHREDFLRNCALCTSELFLLRIGSWDIHPPISDLHCLWFSPGGGLRVPATWAPQLQRRSRGCAISFLRKCQQCMKYPEIYISIRCSLPRGHRISGPPAVISFPIYYILF